LGFPFYIYIEILDSVNANVPLSRVWQAGKKVANGRCESPPLINVRLNVKLDHSVTSAVLQKLFLSLGYNVKKRQYLVLYEHYLS
jgi:hypothetical protein